MGPEWYSSDLTRPEETLKMQAAKVSPVLLLFLTAVFSFNVSGKAGLYFFNTIIGLNLGASNVAKLVIPGEILQNAVQTGWPCVNRTSQSKVVTKSHFWLNSHCNCNVKQSGSRKQFVGLQRWKSFRGLLTNPCIIGITLTFSIFGFFHLSKKPT